MCHLELLKATSTKHGEEKRDDDEVARRCSYPYSELKVRGYMSESKEMNLNPEPKGPKK